MLNGKVMLMGMSTIALLAPTQLCQSDQFNQGVGLSSTTPLFQQPAELSSLRFLLDQSEQSLDKTAVQMSGPLGDGGGVCCEGAGGACGTYSGEECPGGTVSVGCPCGGSSS